MDRFIACIDKLVDVWHSFLDSLATVGGNIFVLMLIWFVSGLCVVRMLTHNVPLDEPTKGALHDVFVGINGALMYALTQRQKNGVSNSDSNYKSLSETKKKEDEDVPKDDNK